MPTKTLIHADKLSLIRGQRLLFKCLSFTLSRGEAIHLKGHNGSGKTSLFKVLNGTLPPDAGTLSILGKAVNDLANEDYKKLLYLGHKTAIKHELTVTENLRLNSRLFDALSLNDEQLSAALAAVGLARFKEQPTGKLSAGQKRRVMLARLWGSVGERHTDKPLWLLDEPLTALDIDAVEALQTLTDKHLSLGGGVVFTSHQTLHLHHSVKTVVLGGGA